MSQQGKNGEHFVDVEEEKWLSNLLYPRQPRDKRPHYVPRGDTVDGGNFYEITKRLSSKSTQISELKAEVDRLNSFYKESVRIDEDSEKKLSELKAEVEAYKLALELKGVEHDQCHRDAESLDIKVKELKECLGKMVEALKKADHSNRCKFQDKNEGCICGHNEALTTAQRLMGEGSK